MRRGCRTRSLAPGLLMVVFLLGSAEPATQPRNHLIRIGPKAYMVSDREPARLSIQKKNTINWVGDEIIFRINFPIDEFPILSDGTRVSVPPLKDMTLGNSKKTWMPNGGANKINPDLRSLIDRAQGHELAYGYRIHTGKSWGHGWLIIQE